MLVIHFIIGRVSTMAQRIVSFAAVTFCHLFVFLFLFYKYFPL
jgi:hypothetical protein